jgi:hypothetical protein
MTTATRSNKKKAAKFIVVSSDTRSSDDKSIPNTKPTKMAQADEARPKAKHTRRIRNQRGERQWLAMTLACDDKAMNLA